jgi:hypothetical protein
VLLVEFHGQLLLLPEVEGPAQQQQQQQQQQQRWKTDADASHMLSSIELCQDSRHIRAQCALRPKNDARIGSRQ